MDVTFPRGVDRKEEAGTKSEGAVIASFYATNKYSGEGFPRIRLTLINTVRVIIHFKLNISLATLSLSHPNDFRSFG